jgi:hypothetical protein
MDGVRQLAEKHANITANKRQIMRYEKGSIELNACALRTQNSQPNEYNFCYEAKTTTSPAAIRPSSI